MYVYALDKDKASRCGSCPDYEFLRPSMEIYKKFTPEKGEYGTFYEGYLKNVDGLTIVEAWERDESKWRKFFAVLEDVDLDRAYAEGKWSVARLIIHCFDAERIFAVRALRLLRGEKKPMTGYDENSYADAIPAEKFTVDELKHQFKITRECTRSIYLHADAERMRMIGEASGYPITARALGLIIPGHNLHHLNVLKERYGFEF